MQTCFSLLNAIRLGSSLGQLLLQFVCDGYFFNLLLDAQSRHHSIRHEYAQTAKNILPCLMSRLDRPRDDVCSLDEEEETGGLGETVESQTYVFDQVSVVPMEHCSAKTNIA